MLHSLLIEPFSFGFMRRALAGCFALSLAGPPLGVFLVLRRMSLMSDVLQHGILPGLALGSLAGGAALWAMTLGGVLAGLAVALLDHQISEYDRQRRWAPPLGIAFIALFTWLALDQTPAWWAAVALFGFFLALQLFGPRRQRHRRRLLKTTDGKPS